jgi:hypothetical protein
VSSFFGPETRTRKRKEDHMADIDFLFRKLAARNPSPRSTEYIKSTAGVGAEVAVEVVEDHQEGHPDLVREEEEDPTRVSPLLRPVEVEAEAVGMGWYSNHPEVTGGRGNGVEIEEIIIEIGGMTDGTMIEEARSAIVIVIVIDTTEIEGGRGREVRVIGIEEAGTIGIEIGTGIEIEKGGTAAAGIGNTAIDGSVTVWVQNRSDPFTDCLVNDMQDICSPRRENVANSIKLISLAQR